MNVCFFFKQKTAYEMRISDWSSDVCSSDLARATAIQVNAEDLSDPVKMQQFAAAQGQLGGTLSRLLATVEAYPEVKKIGRASCRERVCQYVSISVVAVSLKQKEDTENQSPKNYEEPNHTSHKKQSSL